MKSRIQTVDALLAEEIAYPRGNERAVKVSGIRIGILGFEQVKDRDILRRPISKIMDPSTLKKNR